MIARRFDSLFRPHPSDASRRALLARLTGSLLAIRLLASGGETGDAKKRKKRKRCQNQETRCGKKCVRGSCCPGALCALECTCRRSISGKTFCGPINFMAICQQCLRSDDCPQNERCAPDDQCGPEITAVCLPDCQS